MGGACNARWVMRDAYKILVVKPEGKRPFGRHCRRWEVDIKWMLGK
jgi:hypothetical protein